MPEDDKAKTPGRGYLRRRIQILKRLFAGLAIAAGFMSLVEIALRVCFRAPVGIFAAFAPGRDGLYPERSTIRMMWGPVPYMVETNSLGFRSREISHPKDPKTLRIAAIGDSITDGVFVDNDATWEYSLQDMLNAQSQRRVEVLNCARGGASIDKELCILEHLVLPLRPDLVILTFVTNDIAEIQEKDPQALVSMDVSALRSGSDWSITEYSSELTLWILTHTAIGEVFYDTYLTLRSPSYRHGKRRQRSGEARYQIPAGGNFAENAAVFEKRYRKADGLILNEPFSEEASAALENYLYALGRFAELCKEHRVPLLFLYFPAYSQVYNPNASTHINTILEKRCSELTVHFLDLTGAFRANKDAVLHLAPLDFHLNPAGNRVFAAAVVAHLRSSGLLATSNNPNRQNARDP